ncbi:MAG TPA: ABC transporter ATP-binding protein [Opitutaceae bacterium]|jgi:NitT/TauT family transport system ATP-binding protein
MSDEAIIELRRVRKQYGEGPVILEDVSLSARRGDFVTLIGPSGCGKSTILRLISGLSPVTSGSILVDGAEPQGAVEKLSFVFQEPTLLPWCTVERNVELPLRLHGEGAGARREVAARSLALVGLSERSGYYPRQLSGGQKMRVSIARALSVSPKILLLDEPFGALDEMTRDHLNEELLGIRQQLGWTAFFVTHSVPEAVFLSSRIVVMASNPGRIHTEIPVGLPYPRTVETRQSRDFQGLVAEVSRTLRSVERLP